MIHLAIKLWKVSFIRVWKMARLLVILKNITKGLKSLLLVQNVAFYLSLGLIWILLKSQLL